jgi:hypothetical protein
LGVAKTLKIETSSIDIRFKERVGFLEIQVSEKAKWTVLLIWIRHLRLSRRFKARQLQCQILVAFV